MRLTFHGGAGGMVTGANYLFESSSTGSGQATKILVDCGLHQGSNFCEAHNFEPFPYDPKEIEAVFVTHSHIDHIGRLPQLYKNGFRGKVYSTPPTKDFAELLLIDSEHILREETERRRKAPIYEVSDILELMKLWSKVKYHEKINVGPFSAEFYNSGHILGAASVVLDSEGKRVVISGDLGNMPAPFINPTEYIERADYALIESAYGGRVHERLAERKDLLEDLIEETVRMKGVLMIPAFALERTQGLLFEFNELVESGRIPRVPIFIDSPLAIRLTAIYQKYSEDKNYFKSDAIQLIKSGDAIFNFPGLKMTLTTEQSKEINDVPPPKVIIAGAGMSNAGRILHHEKRYLSDPKSTILFIGYQAAESLGRRILDGVKEVKILGESITVMTRVKAIGAYSAHADQTQLLEWLKPMRGSLKKVFVVQGEEDQATALSLVIKDKLVINSYTPSLAEEVML